MALSRSFTFDTFSQIAHFIKPMGWVSLAFGVTWLSGCATMSLQECQTADWQMIGYRDGKAGQDKDYVLNHNKACRKANIAPNKLAWEQGRQQGLTQYCTATNAYNLGRSGYRINAVCPIDQRLALQNSNEQGLKIHQLSKRVEADKAERDKLNNQYKKMLDGDNLEFKTEKEARTYLSELPHKIDTLTQQINQNTQLLKQLQNAR
ncbi:MAG: DUF2799 domain-containing protein [Moraxella sp.]|jgi:hypothetical protein